MSRRSREYRQKLELADARMEKQSAIREQKNMEAGHGAALTVCLLIGLVIGFAMGVAGYYWWLHR